MGEFELVVSELLLAELDNALAYPELRSRIPAGEGGLFVAGLRRPAELVPDPQQAAPRSSDPGDDYLLALAETASAVIVSGDRHLLDLEGRLPVRSVRGFLDTLEGELPSH